MENRSSLAWQSRLVLLLTLPAIGADLVLEVHWWAVNMVQVMAWVMALSALLGLAAWTSGAATRHAVAAGVAIALSIGFSTTVYPYTPWRSGLTPLALTILLTSVATRVRRIHKVKEGRAESAHGRNAVQVAANLGVAALAFSGAAQSLLINGQWIQPGNAVPGIVIGLAALAEAAGDTVSSEIGRAVGGPTRLLTTMRRVEPGTDGGFSLVGSVAGMAAAALVALAGVLLLSGGMRGFYIACGGGIVGFFFDSLLGATLERRGWLNNDLVNFLSTLCAALVALGLLVMAG